MDIGMTILGGVIGLVIGVILVFIMNAYWYRDRGE